MSSHCLQLSLLLRLLLTFLCLQPSVISFVGWKKIMLFSLARQVSIYYRIIIHLFFPLVVKATWLSVKKMHQLKLDVNCHTPWIPKSGKKDTGQIFQSYSLLGQDPYVPFSNLKLFFSNHKSRKALQSRSSWSTQSRLALLDGSTAGYQRGSGKGFILANAGMH